MRIEFGTTEIAEIAANPVAPATKKHGWLPVLVVLFLISYALMTLLIVEQGRTIESQRALIHELFRDSNELSAARRAEENREQSRPADVQTPAAQIPTNRAQSSQTQSNVTPSNVAPSPQAPAKHTPSTQVTPQSRAQNESAKQKPFRMPSKPASDLVDADRSLMLI